MTSNLHRTQSEHYVRLIAALSLTAGSALNNHAFADSTGASSNLLDSVIVTGTRQTGMAVLDSPAPIQVLTAEALRAASGSPDLMSTISQLVPSLTLQTFGYDMSGQTLQARLRGVSPNHVLILINGKRRHTTANFSVVSGSPFQGGANVDLNFIPLDAIDHIEVLTDGAAAQYGTDAIAGVINILLKANPSGGSLNTAYGEYGTGGGKSNNASGNIGFAPTQSTYLNITADYKFHGRSFVGAIDERLINPANLSSYPNSNMLSVPGYPYINRISGDGQIKQKTMLLNAGMDLQNGNELYFFASYGHKEAASFENYRLPEKAHYIDPAQPNITVYPYPFGFSPQEAADEDDYQANIGFRGHFSNWNYDLSTGFGADKFAVYTLHSYNTGYASIENKPSPTDFYDGLLKASQWTTSIDLNRDVNMGFAGLVNMAFGGEYRRDTYVIDAGTPLSYLNGGAASYPGFTPSDAGAHSRTNRAIYGDFAATPSTHMRLDAAARFERYSDFGNTFVAKLTGRYELSAALALRGTLNNGFRAPTLAEEHYTSTYSGPRATYAQLAPDSAGGRSLGLGDGLKPEHSTNLSIGAVWRPASHVSVTLDAYQILITDRIVGSGSLIGSHNGSIYSSLINTALYASGGSVDPDVVANGTTGVSVFSNGVDTRTRGLDLVFDLPVTYEFGKINWSIGANYSETSVTKYAVTPPGIAGGNPPLNQLYDANAYSNLTTANPRYVVNLGALFTRGNLSINLVEKLYGPSWDWESDNGDNGQGGPFPACTPTGGLFICAGGFQYFKNVIHFTPITNLDVTYKMTSQLALSFGALNLFNTFPPHLNATQLAHLNSSYYGDNAGTSQYTLFSPFGFNGGYYYIKAGYRF